MWSPREAARILLLLLLQYLDRDLDRGDGPLVFGIDETLERRRGARIRARGIYRDAVRSSRHQLVKASGLRWISLIWISLMWLGHVPWAGRHWALLGLFSWTTLAAHALQKRHPITQRTAAWYDKPSPTFVDAIALVRRHLWLSSEGFSLSAACTDTLELPAALYNRMVDSLAYAA